MPGGFYYYMVLLLIIIFLLKILMNLKETCPRKMRGYMTISLSIAMVSFMSRLYQAMEWDQRRILWLKPLIYADNLASILFGIIIFYILLRKERLGFGFAYAIMALLIVLYGSSMILTGQRIMIDSDCGYVLLMTDDFPYRVFFIFLMAVVSWSIILFYSYRFALKVPLAALFIISLAVICENILYAGGLHFFPYPVLSEMFLVMLLDFTLNIKSHKTG